MGDPPVDLREYVANHLAEALHSQSAILMAPDGQFRIAPDATDEALLRSLARLSIAVLEILGQYQVEIDLLGTPPETGDPHLHLGDTGQQNREPLAKAIRDRPVEWVRTRPALTGTTVDEALEFLVGVTESLTAAVNTLSAEIAELRDQDAPP